MISGIINLIFNKRVFEPSNRIVYSLDWIEHIFFIALTNQPGIDARLVIVLYACTSCSHLRANRFIHNSLLYSFDCSFFLFVVWRSRVSSRAAFTWSPPRTPEDHIVTHGSDVSRTQVQDTVLRYFVVLKNLTSLLSLRRERILVTFIFLLMCANLISLYSVRVRHGSSV